MIKKSEVVIYVTGLIVTVSTLWRKTGTLVPLEGINRIKSATSDTKKKVKKDTRTLLKVKKVAQVIKRRKLKDTAALPKR